MYAVMPSSGSPLRSRPLTKPSIQPSSGASVATAITEAIRAFSSQTATRPPSSAMLENQSRFSMPYWYTDMGTSTATNIA